MEEAGYQGPRSGGSKECRGSPEPRIRYSGYEETEETGGEIGDWGWEGWNSRFGI